MFTAKKLRISKKSRVDDPMEAVFKE